MLAKLHSIAHGSINAAAKKALGEGLAYKHSVVAYHNVQARINSLLYGRQSYDFLNANGCRFRDVYLCREHYYQNCLYGIANSLKSFCGWEGPICACIEHGVFLGDFVVGKEVFNSGLPGLITFSNTRLERIGEVSDIPVYPIGPYITYAAPFLSREEFIAVKNELGKTLLAFPSHSIQGTTACYDLGFFVGKLNHLAREGSFDSVLICLYYTDVERGLGDYYVSKGFRVVCAGHRKDPVFLPRLRSLIDLADYSVSNSCGTHIGYCVALGTPHALIKQNVDYETASKLENNSNTSSTSYRDQAEIEGVFSGYSGITPDQIGVCNKYWGCDLVRTPKELFAVFEKLQAQYEEKRSR